MIDIEELLKPIREDAPTGLNLRWEDSDTTFRTIEDNRVDEDPDLVFDRTPRSADWRRVMDTAREALAHRSKDLQLAAWLTEALVRTDGFEGLRQGIGLMRSLMDQFWDGLHPGNDGDGEVDLAMRAAPFKWLTSPNGFLLSLKEIEIANPDHRWSDYERALQIEQADPDDAREMLASGGTTRAAWLQTARAMSPDAAREFLASLDACEEELTQLRRDCDERLGDESPLLTPLDDFVAEVRRVVTPLWNLGGDAESAPGEALPVGQAPVAGAASSAPAGPIQTRRQALNRLQEVANYFRQTEPHSPLSHLIERAVRWGDMSFQQLMKEVIKSDDTLKHMWEMLGIDPSKPETSIPTPEPGAPPPAAAPTPSKDSDDGW